MHRTIIILITMVMSVPAFAQPHGQMRGRTGIEQVEAEKIAFFTKYLELTPDQAKEFWPVYDDFQNRRVLIIQERQNLTRYFGQNSANMDEKEAGEIADRYIGLQVQETALAQEYHDKFKKVLPASGVMLLYQAENEFRNQLLRRLRLGRGQEEGRGRIN